MSTVDEPSNRRDDLSDLDPAIGGSTFGDIQVRVRCIELAIAATPTSYEVEGRVPEIALTARRFARFALEGTTPWLGKIEAPVATSAMPK